MSSILIVKRTAGRDESGLSQVLDASRASLTKRAVRYPAVDARSFTQPPLEEEVDPFYTLGDQLFVEPSRALCGLSRARSPDSNESTRIAVARSHIGVWRRIAAGEHASALVLETMSGSNEDCSTARSGVAEMDGEGRETSDSTSLFVVQGGEVRAQKTFLPAVSFRPVRGLWYLSGYVLSREGAAKLLHSCLVEGPWTFGLITSLEH